MDMVFGECLNYCSVAVKRRSDQCKTYKIQPGANFSPILYLELQTTTPNPGSVSDSIELSKYM